MKQPETQNNQFISRDEAAQLLNVSNRTINRWVDRGFIKAWRTAGGQARIYRDSVKALLKQDDASLPAAGNPTILVVEDDPEIREFICTHIASMGLPVHIIQASDGFEGLILVGREDPELVITDLLMPGLDGFEMIRSLRHKPAQENLSIVSITMLDDEEISERGGLPKDVKVLRKPVQVSELSDLVQDWFFTRSQQAESQR